MPSVSGVSGAGAAAAYGGSQGRIAPPGQLTDDQQRDVRELAKRDREVRQHEQAHLSAAGGYAKGGPTYTYTRGPDGQQYATGGEVQIDVSPGRTPQETIAKAQVVQRAALAPAEPSAQDRSVAGAAARLELRARQQLAQQQTQQPQPAKSSGTGGVARGQQAYRSAADSQTDAAPGLNVVA